MALILIGDVIKAFSVDARLDVRKYHDGASWVFNPAISGGGCLIDSAINAISIVVSIAGCLEAAEVAHFHHSLPLTLF